MGWAAGLPSERKPASVFSRPPTTGTSPDWKKEHCPRPRFCRLGACSELLRQHLGIGIVNWDQLVGAVGPQRCWWEHPQPQVQVIAGMWWGNLAGRARRTWGNLRVKFGCSQGIGCGIRAHLTAQQPCKACQVLGLQKLFWIGVMWRRVTPYPVSFLSFREAIYFLRVPGILQSLQDSPQTLILPRFLHDVEETRLPCHLCYWHLLKDTASARDEASTKICPSVLSCDWLHEFKNGLQYSHTNLCFL